MAIDAADSFADVSTADIKISNVTYTIFKNTGFESQHHVNAIESHRNLPETGGMRLTVIGFGDVAFIAAPYEMFSATGKNIKNASPFKTPVVTTITGGHGYLPTMEAWDYGCYEQYSSNYERGHC